MNILVYHNNFEFKESRSTSTEEWCITRKWLNMKKPTYSFAK